MATKIYIKFGKKLYETNLTILPYKGVTLFHMGIAYKVTDVIIYSDLNKVHIII